MMAGGEELEELGVELDLIAKRDPSEAGKLEHQVPKNSSKTLIKISELEKSECPMIK